MKDSAPCFYNQSLQLQLHHLCFSQPQKFHGSVPAAYRVPSQLKLEKYGQINFLSYTYDKILIKDFCKRAVATTSALILRHSSGVILMTLTQLAAVEGAIHDGIYTCIDVSVRSQFMYSPARALRTASSYLLLRPAFQLITCTDSGQLIKNDKEEYGKHGDQKGNCAVIIVLSVFLVKINAFSLLQPEILLCYSLRLVI